MALERLCALGLKEVICSCFPCLILDRPKEVGTDFERFLRCPLIYYWHKTLRRGGGSGTIAMPLARGTIGHIGLAHYYARVRAMKAGKLKAEIDATILSPRDAMIIRAEQLGRLDLLPMMSEVVRGYIEHYGIESFDVVDVEKPIETTFGVSARFTARADLVTRDRIGVWIYDHKFVGRIDKKSLRRYTNSGQFLGLQHLGRSAYGASFAGVILNLVGCNDGEFCRQQVEPSPWLFERFPALVAATEARLAVLEQNEVELRAKGWDPALPWAGCAAPSEMTCYTPYGECEWFETCRWGAKK